MLSLNDIWHTPLQKICCILTNQSICADSLTDLEKYITVMELYASQNMVHDPHCTPTFIQFLKDSSDVIFLSKSLSHVKILYNQQFEPLSSQEIRYLVKAWNHDKVKVTHKMGHINTWNTSKITNMSHLFYNLHNFNEYLDGWDVSNVTNMSHMFAQCSSFNQPLPDWNVSNVTDMSFMLYYCSSFNSPLPEWNNLTYQVQDMSAMFCKCELFNQPLPDWDVSNVKNMISMFNGCVSFNQILPEWDVHNVKNMTSMFKGCTSFNQALPEWNIHNVEYMTGMFRGCTLFDQTIYWDVSGKNTTDILLRSPGKLKLKLKLLLPASSNSKNNVFTFK